MYSSRAVELAPPPPEEAAITVLRAGRAAAALALLAPLLKETAVGTMHLEEEIVAACIFLVGWLLMDVSGVAIWKEL